MVTRWWKGETRSLYTTTLSARDSCFTLSRRAAFHRGWLAEPRLLLPLGRPRYNKQPQYASTFPGALCLRHFAAVAMFQMRANPSLQPTRYSEHRPLYKFEWTPTLGASFDNLVKGEKTK